MYCLYKKRKGIQTRQIGRRKEKSIHTVEMLMSVAALGAPAAQLVLFFFGWSYMPAGARFTGFCIGMLHLRILRDCFLLLFPAAVNLNVLPGNIACVVTRKKAYQVCVFHIAACSSYKGMLARLGIAYVIVIRGAYTSRRNAVHQYSLIRHLFGKRPCERNKRCFTLEIHSLPFLINNFY